MRAAKFEVKLWQERVVGYFEIQSSPLPRSVTGRYAQDCRQFEPNPGLPRVARKFRRDVT